MARKITTSITAKLFYLMTTVILITVIGMSVQSSAKFKTFLTQNVQDGSLTQADRAANDVAANLDSLTGKISVILPKIDLGSNNSSAAKEIVGLMKNEPEIVSTSVFFSDDKQLKQIVAEKSPYPAAGVVDNRFEGKAPDAVKLLTLHVEKKAVSAYSKVKTASAVQVQSIAAETGLPLMLLTVRFDVERNGGEKVYVSVAVWQTRILVALPKSKSTDSVIIDQNGELFASSDINELIQQTTLKTLPLAAAALSRVAPSGFQDVYLDLRGKERLGAYSQIPGYPNLFVLVQKDAEAAFLVISRNYYSAILWAALFTLISVMLSYIGAGNATGSIRELLVVTREIASGNFSARVRPRTTDEIAELGVSVNHMAAKITDLLSSQVEKARYEKELETARMVQSTFFPKQDVREGPLTVTGFYQPATECGGDLWGHYRVDDTRQLVFIADAMGHGAPSALVTAIGYATCQAVATILVDEPGLNSSPSVLLKRLNRIIFDAVEGKISMTFFAALLDFGEGTITYSNAGHNFPVILTGNAQDERLSKQAKGKEANAHIIPLQLQGTPLGVDRLAEFKEKTVKMVAGDRIFFFTDGLIENHYDNQQPMGRKNLLDLLGKCGDSDCFSIKQSALDAAVNLFGSTNLADDITIVVAEIDPNWGKGRVPAPPVQIAKTFDNTATIAI